MSAVKCKTVKPRWHCSNILKKNCNKLKINACVIAHNYLSYIAINCQCTEDVKFVKDVKMWNAEFRVDEEERTGGHDSPASSLLLANWWSIAFRNNLWEVLVEWLDDVSSLKDVVHHSWNETWVGVGVVFVNR